MVERGPRISFEKGVTAASGRQKKVLELTALGKTKNEIADDLKVSESTVKTHATKLRFKKDESGRNAMTKLIVNGITTGEIDKGPILESCNPKGFNDLTNEEIDLIGYLKEGFTNKDIMGKVHLSEGAIKTRLVKIFKKIGTKNREHTVAVSLSVPEEFLQYKDETKKEEVTPRQISIIQLLSIGHTIKEISEKMHLSESSIKTDISKFKKIINPEGDEKQSKPAFLKEVLDRGYLDEEAILESCYADRFKDLSGREKDVLTCFKDGITEDEIATKLKINISTVKTYISRIYDKLGTRNRDHAVTVLFVLEKRAETAKELAPDLQKETVIYQALHN